MSVRDIERRILTSPARPLVLRKRKAGKRGRRDDDPKHDEPDADDKGGKADGDADDEGKEDKEDDADDEARGDGPGTIEGYAAVFHDESDPGTEYKLWDDRDMVAVERIARGAFKRAIEEKEDCRALFNHDPNLGVLGRVSSGTLRLEEDEKGLRYEADLPDTTLARDLATSIERGDINGSSFGFVVRAESWRQDEAPDGRIRAVRTIEDVELLDVSPVTYPAYGATTAGARSRLGMVRALGSVDEARASYERWKKAEADRLPLAAKLAKVRARAVEVQAGA